MQLCEDCGANPATVHLTRIVNETAQVSHLCEKCSRKKGLSISIAHDFPMPEAEPEKAASCPRCQLSFSEFKTKGLLGCCDCYRHFEKDIDSLLMQVHGSTVHKGKLYRHSGPDKLDVKEIERLKTELTEAIEREEFELAALIRDTIHSIDTHDAKEAQDQTR